MNPKAKPGVEELMELAHGYRQAKVLMVACKLDIFSRIGERTVSAQAIASYLGLKERALTILLDALAALGLLEKKGGRYANSSWALECLIEGRPGYRGNIIKHMDNCWNSWSNLICEITGGQPKTDSGLSFFEDETENRSFIWGMNDMGRERAAMVLPQLDLSRVRRMLDLGGGAATYSIAFAKAYPALQSTVFDLPLTLKVARENIHRHNLSARIGTREGNFYSGEIGQGYDLVWISQILHSESEADCERLLSRAYEALAPGGRIMVHDFWLSEDRTVPLNAALFAVHMLAVTGGEGRVYTASEIEGWLRKAGFTQTKVTNINQMAMLVEGTK